MLWQWVMPLPGKGLWALGGSDVSRRIRTLSRGKSLLGVGAREQVNWGLVGYG